MSSAKKANMRATAKQEFLHFVFQKNNGFSTDKRRAFATDPSVNRRFFPKEASFAALLFSFLLFSITNFFFFTRFFRRVLRAFWCKIEWKPRKKGKARLSSVERRAERTIMQEQVKEQRKKIAVGDRG
jgi:hypothetical protein